MKTAESKDLKIIRKLIIPAKIFGAALMPIIFHYTKLSDGEPDYMKIAVAPSIVTLFFGILARWTFKKSIGTDTEKLNGYTEEVKEKINTARNRRETKIYSIAFEVIRLIISLLLGYFFSMIFLAALIGIDK